MASRLTNEFVSRSISKLYLDSNTADVNFSFLSDCEIVPAHKAILAVSTPVFEAMFLGPLKENNVVKIVDASASAFKEFLQFFYLSKVTFTMENIETVIRLADKYDMTDCLQSCVNYIKYQLRAEKLLWGYRLALSINNQQLREYCEEEIKNYTNTILKGHEFRNCDKFVMDEILRMDSLHCTETDIFIACVEWAKVACKDKGLNENDPEILKEELSGCLKLIRFGGMPMEDIGAILKNEQYNKLFTRTQIADIFCMKNDCSYRSTFFKHSSPRKLEWLKCDDVICSVASSSTSDAINLLRQESTYFSSNITLILGEIDLVSIIRVRNIPNIPSLPDARIRPPPLYSISARIFLFEYNDQSFTMMHVSRSVYVGMVRFLTEATGPSILLPQPILISPNKMYEIRVDVLIVDDFKHKHEYVRESAFHSDVLIKFHRNPCLKNEERRGLVSALHFNQFL